MDDRFQTHLFTYRHDGATWILELQARDAEDARARIGKLAYATYDGVLMAKIPAGAGLIARAMCAAQNVLRVFSGRFARVASPR